MYISGLSKLIFHLKGEGKRRKLSFPSTVDNFRYTFRSPQYSFIASYDAKNELKNSQIWAKNTQQVATHRNTLAKRTQHVAPGLIYIRIILIFSCFLYRERLSYLKRPQIYFNLFDWLGLILILIVIPLRFSRREAQWFVASLGFFFNVLRLLKYSCITRQVAAVIRRKRFV